MSDIFTFLNNFKTKPFFRNILIAFVFLLGLFLISFLIFLSQKPSEPGVPPPLPSLSDQGKIIATIGNEQIFESDLEAELAYYPFQPTTSQKTKELKERLLTKIIQDSELLQEADEKGLISLDETVFNSPNKNYTKRIELVKEAKVALQAYEGQISGESIAVWCYNIYVPKIGIKEALDQHMSIEEAREFSIQKAKEIAREKIEKLYQDIKIGKITIKEAGEIIKNDSSLADIDPQYKTNAYQKFESLPKDEPFYLSEEANKVLWSLEEGELSPILTLKDTSADGKVRDSIFLIIKVAKREGIF
ncbi:SurA N-terminal domain-containing protein [Patescibacteria group bacterium]|nr:SurA N-terminal domain-containing protein [Patescibacteria group bacterium]